MSRAAPTDSTGAIRTYFSHSYRPEDKHRNWFFWQLFRDSKFYFTVDAKTDDDLPMSVASLERLMRRSQCFVAVVPRRASRDPSVQCSPYQIFESNLALRADKPRLIFLENDLPSSPFNASDDEIVTFDPTAYETQRREFERRAAALISRIPPKEVSISQDRKPIALVLREYGAYTEEVQAAIRTIVRSNGFLYGRRPVEARIHETYTTLLREIEEYELLICDVRLPYMAPDILGSIYSRTLPTIWVAHLQDGEDPVQARQAMQLSLDERDWKPDPSAGWPTLFKSSQLDDGMHPVIIWRHIEELTAELDRQLRKVAGLREQWLTQEQARRYFMRIGRRDEAVFISNESSQNPLGRGLTEALRQEDIRVFHYTDPGAIPVGARDWLAHIYDRIERSGVFVMLITPEYFESEYCRQELQYALKMYAEHKIRIQPYPVKEIEWPKSILGRVEGIFLLDRPEQEQVATMSRLVIGSLEADDEAKRELWPLVDGRELCMLVRADQPPVALFDALEFGQFKGLLPFDADLRLTLLRLLKDEATSADQLDRVVDAVGEELHKELWAKQPALQNRYSNLLEASGTNVSSVRFCFTTDSEAASVPFEWMQLEPNGRPLCLRHPVRRYLLNQLAGRRQLNTLPRDGIRVLVVACNTGDIPAVDAEGESVATAWSSALGADKVRLVPSREATVDQVRKLLTSREYHVFHFAGHGAVGPDGATILLRGPRRKTQPVGLAEVQEWIRQSDVRFAYLSTCEGAASSVRQWGSRRRTWGLAEGLIEARVPEVIAFTWAVPDDDSFDLARVFYARYVHDLLPEAALLEARLSLERRGSISWATPVLIQQY
jgi:hypothetical protein